MLRQAERILKPRKQGGKLQRHNFWTCHYHCTHVMTTAMAIFKKTCTRLVPSIFHQGQGKSLRAPTSRNELQLMFAGERGGIFFSDIATEK